MDEETSLEPIIRKHVALATAPNSRDWWPCLCMVCMDHGKKGLRAAFKFDGDAIGYNCFNCGHTGAYDPDKPFIDKNGKKHLTLSDNMTKVMDSFGIPETEYSRVIFNNIERVAPTGAKPKAIVSREPSELALPTFFYYLDDADEDDKWAQVARMYLEDRGIDPTSYPFMLAKKASNPILHKWLKRVIIPVYKEEKLIYYQGRDLTGKAVKKYENPAADRGRVLYGYSELHKRTDAPLYIVEGWFDAYSIDGVAIMGNSLLSEQISIINTSRRPIVYIPDRFGDGDRGAEQALKNGWSISTPEIGSCKDMDEATSKYGKMYVMKSLAENTSNGFQAETLLQIYCS